MCQLSVHTYMHGGKPTPSSPSGWVCVTSSYPLDVLCGSQSWVGASVPSCRGLAQWKSQE